MACGGESSINIEGKVCDPPPPLNMQGAEGHRIPRPPPKTTLIRSKKRLWLRLLIYSDKRCEGENRGERERPLKEEKEERRSPPHGCSCQLWEPR